MKRPLFTLVTPLFLLLALVSCGGGTGGSSSSTPQTVKIALGDFYLHASQTSFETGTKYRFAVTNEGKHNHDLFIMHPMQTETMTMDDIFDHALVSVANIAPGQSKNLDMVFDHTAPAGMLELSDRYGGHYEAGMHQNIVVNAPQGTSVAPYPNNGVPADTDTTVSNAGGKCDPAISVKLGANNAYDPSSVSLKRGNVLTIVNTTQQEYTLTTQPDAGIRFTTVDPGETEHIPFPRAGSFVVSSKEHPSATLAVQVADTPGITCGFNPVATINFDAIAGSSQYFVRPTTVTLKENQSIILSNVSDATGLTFVSKPDADLGNPKLDVNEHQFFSFGEEGTYTISCVQFPEAKFTVVVQGDDDDD